MGNPQAKIDDDSNLSGAPSDPICFACYRHHQD
jgi:hypothetical protein